MTNYKSHLWDKTMFTLVSKMWFEILQFFEVFDNNQQITASMEYIVYSSDKLHSGLYLEAYDLRSPYPFS